MKVAVIPARGGSKRITKKNIKNFCGKPIIVWSIETAINSGLFDRIIVSTDDDDIASVAESCGAEIPFIRPKALADDFADTSSVVVHAIKYLQSKRYPVETVCCIYATAPFIRIEDLIDGLNKIESEKTSFAFPISRYPFPVQRALKLDLNKKIQMLDPSKFAERSQDLEETFHDAGQFYWGTVDAWLSGQPIFNENSVPIFISPYRSHDIDTPDDWTEAELKFELLQKRTVRN